MSDRITVDGIDYVRAYPVAEDRCPHCGAGPRAWTPAQVIARIQAEPHAPKAEHWLHEGAIDRPTFSTVRRMFGTWNRALEAAGFTRRRPHGSVPYWTREQIIAALHAWAREHGGQPRYSDWENGVAEHPSSTTVRKVFGTWNAAIDAAGFVPLTSYGNRAPEDRATGEVGPDTLVDAGHLRTALHLVDAAELRGLAEVAGVTPDYLYQIKRGRIARVRFSYADRIAVALDRPDLLAA